VHCGWPYVPGDVVNAQMSLRYGVAAVLATGDAFVEQFTDERVHDPQLLALSRRVDVRADESIDQRGSDHRHVVSVELTTASGEVFRDGADHRRGSHFDPVGRAEIVDKFRTLTDPLEGVDGEAILVSVLALEELEDVRALATVLRAGDAT
jgi:2-methylcitrate dehydratase PrpD